MKRRPPYVKRTVVYAILDWECGHHDTAADAYDEIAGWMWFNAERAGRVPRMPRGVGDSDSAAWMDRHERTTKRLARWLAWVDSKQPEGTD